MPETFKCPSCSAPLKFQGKMVQTCKFCGSDVIVPNGFAKPKERVGESAFDYVEPYPEREVKPQSKDETLADASELGQKALKIAEIKRAIKENKKVSAAILFRDNFGGSLADAKEIIEAIKEGKSIHVPDLKPEAPPSSSSKRTFLLIAAAAIFLILLLILSGIFFG